MRFAAGVVGRREFLRVLAGTLAFPALARIAAATDSPSYPFSEVPSSASGITWTHTAGLSPEKYLPQSTGAGCAFLDYDNDGWMDIYLVNSGKCDIFTPAKPLRNALYRNNRDGTFTDVTEKAGVIGGGYGMGVAVGDYNADGFPDLYVTQYGRSILYRNNGDGTFTDVTERAGVAAPGWASSAVWFDYDNDGRLDLFVCHFVDFDKSKHHNCGAPNIPAIKGLNEYCYPRIYSPMASWLFHNNGDGTFTDVSQKMGIADNPGKSWGVVATDINNDGWMDLFVTDLNHELDGFYQNRHDETFDDIAAPSGIANVTKLMSGWGVKFLDYDNDGNLDLMIANGHPDDLIEKIYDSVGYRERILLFHNDGTGLKNVTQESGPAFSHVISARGLALGDFDNDGGIDVLISCNDEPPVLLHNNVGSQNHWLGINLIGKKANIDAIGARVAYQAGDLKRSRMKVGGGSYLSSHDPRMVLGIGRQTKLDWLEVEWPQPSSLVERFTDLPIDRYITIVEGQGKWK